MRIQNCSALVYSHIAKIIRQFLLGYLYIPISPPPQTCYHLPYATFVNGQYPLISLTHAN